MKLKTKEQDVVKAILDYLTLRRIGHAHVKTTGNIIQRKGKTFFGKGQNKRGTPDIFLCYHGHGITIEVKSSAGRLSPEQTEWLKNWEKEPTFGIWIVARSVQEVESLLDSLDGKTRS